MRRRRHLRPLLAAQGNGRNRLPTQNTKRHRPSQKTKKYGTTRCVVGFGPQQMGRCHIRPSWLPQDLCERRCYHLRSMVDPAVTLLSAGEVCVRRRAHIFETRQETRLTSWFEKRWASSSTAPSLLGRTFIDQTDNRNHSHQITQECATVRRGWQLNVHESPTTNFQ